MQTDVPVTYNHQGVPTASARDIARALWVPDYVFSDWLKDLITEWGFVKNKDYIVVQGEVFFGLRMAQHAAMLDKSDKGMAIRDYFISLETRQPRSRLSSVGTRAVLNARNVPHGYFPVIEEAVRLIDKVYAVHNVDLSPDSQFDISVGLAWVKHLKQIGTNLDAVRVEYPHNFNDNRKVQMAWAYSEDLLPEFRKFFRDVWEPNYADRNFRKDPVFFNAYQQLRLK